MPAHDRVTRSAALELLEASAAANGGTPVWREASRDSGLDRVTLQKWWAQRGQGARARPTKASRGEGGATAADSAVDALKLIHLPKAKQLKDPLRHPDIRYYKWLHDRIAQDMDLCRLDGKGTALASLHQRLEEAHQAYRAAVHEETKRTGATLSPDELADELRKGAQEMAPDHADIFLEVFRTRGLV